MSSAKKDEDKFSSCLHVRKFVFAFFHRAKPVSEKERSGFERALRRREKRKESRPRSSKKYNRACTAVSREAKGIPPDRARNTIERALRHREKRKESRPIEHETLSSADSGIHSSKRASHESSMKSHRTCHAASIALKTPSVATPQ